MQVTFVLAPPPTTQATEVVAFKAVPVAYKTPSVGAKSPIAEEEDCKIVVVVKSEAVEFTQLKSTSPVPAVPEAFVTSTGEALSIVIVALMPSFAFVVLAKSIPVPLMPVTVEVTE